MSGINDKDITRLSNAIEGRIVVPDDSDYDQVRTIWNGMIDKRPALIVQCAASEDVPPAIEFAQNHGLELSIRGGGHHIAGNSLVDNGLVIDFSAMREIRVDPSKKRAYVEPGATLADLDEATQAHGLAVPTGINSTTGIAGLTLGGGFGWLTRRYGLTIDSLVSAEVVTADGRCLKASETENPDLFWAIRGGGGNFGVVTGFEFKLHEVGPEVFAGLIVFPIEQANKMMRQTREFSKSAPVELNLWTVLRHAPPLPFLPEEIHGKMVTVLPLFYLGEQDKGDEFVKYLSGFGDPHGVHAGMMPYTQWQQAFDSLLTPGARNYWKSHYFTELSDGVLDAVTEYAGSMPSPHCEIFVASISGAANKIPADAMAYASRDANYVMNVHGRWEEASRDKICIQWARDFFEATLPYASAGAYTNFMTEDETERVESAYGLNLERLIQLKKKYDPKNLFHMNHNIKPKPFIKK